MVYFVAMETFIKSFLSMHVFARCIAYVQSMCVPILRSIGTKLACLENIKNKIVFYLTS